MVSPLRFELRTFRASSEHSTIELERHVFKAYRVMLWRV